MKESVYRNPGRHRYVANYLAIVLTMLASFCSYRLCFHFYGEEALAIYAISRRVLRYWIAFVASGLGVSLCYHVAEGRAKDSEGSGHWCRVALWLLGLCYLPLLSFTLLAPATVASWFFGSSQLSHIATPIILFMGSIGIQILLSSYFSGRMEIVRASLLMACVTAILPILSFLFFQSSFVGYLWGVATLGLLCNVCFYGVFVRPTLQTEPSSPTSFMKRVRSTVVYASSRVPGGFLMVAILNLPVSLATHASTELTAAAAISVGVALVELVATGVAPLSNVYLPQAAFLVARGTVHELRASVLRVFGLVLLGSVAYVVGLSVYIDQFLTVFLGSSTLGYAPYVEKVLPAAPGYALFRCFRGFVDGVSRKPLTTLSTIVSLVPFGLVLAISSETSMTARSVDGMVVGISCLGLLTTLQTFWFLRTPNLKR